MENTVAPKEKNGNIVRNELVSLLRKSSALPANVKRAMKRYYAITSETEFKRLLKPNMRLNNEDTEAIQRLVRLEILELLKAVSVWQNPIRLHHESNKKG